MPTYERFRRPHYSPGDRVRLVLRHGTTENLLGMSADEVVTVLDMEAVQALGRGVTGYIYRLRRANLGIIKLGEECLAPVVGETVLDGEPAEKQYPTWPVDLTDGTTWDARALTEKLNVLYALARDVAALKEREWETRTVTVTGYDSDDVDPLIERARAILG